MQKALHGRPWFVTGNFLSVRHWEPNFVPEEATQTHTTIWVKLPQLPTEFYDLSILERIENKLGRLLKIDTCTSAALRGRYTRIYKQVPLDKPVKTFVIVGPHKQRVIYEGAGVLCTGCERLGYATTNCPFRTHNHTSISSKDTPSSSNLHTRWKNGAQSPFPKRRLPLNVPKM